MKLLKLTLVSLAMFSATFANAQSAKIGNISIDGAYTRATVQGQKVAGGFMKISNQGAADQLVSGSTPAAEELQLHTMSMEDNVMKMRQVNAIDVPANGSVELKPGGLHIMFIGIKSPFAPGTMVPVKLKFAKAGEVEIKLPVNAMPDMPAGHGANKH